MNIIKYIKHPFSFFKDLKVRRLNGKYGQALSDEEYLKKMFKVKTGKELNLDDPQCYTEKLQWLKLYNHNPEYTVMVDKYRAKEYVAEKIGEEYIIPTLKSINLGNLRFDFVIFNNKNNIDYIIEYDGA